MCRCSVGQELCEDLVDLAASFDAIDVWLKQYLDDLDILITDHELLASGEEDDAWRINFAVDYCDIHGFLFPFDEVIQNYEERKNDLTFRRRVTLEYLARMCVFTLLASRNTPILIGPYLTEFTHRFLTYTETDLAKRDINDYVTTLWNEVQDKLEELGEPIDALDFDRIQSIPDSELMEILIQRFPHLVLIARAEGYGLHDRLRMIGRSGLRSIPLGNPLGRSKIDEIGTQFWKDELYSQRGSRGWIQTTRDAQALASIEEANQSAREKGDKTLYLLISGSGDVIEAVKRAREKKGRELVLPNGQHTSILRPIRMFLIYLKHARDVSSEANHAANISILERLNAARDACVPVSDTFKETRKTLEKCPRRNAKLEQGEKEFRCELAENEERIRKNVIDATTLRDEYENAQLILSENPDFEAFTTKIMESEDADALEHTVTHVVRRMLVDVSLRMTIEKYTDELRNELIMSVVSFNAQVDVCTRKLIPEMVAYLLEAPFHIEFQSTSVQRRFEQFFERVDVLASTHDILGIQEAFGNLMNVTLDAELVPYERELVELVILLAFSRNSLAARLSRACLELEVGELRPEFEYLNIRALLRYDMKTAKMRCAEAALRYPSDPRFHFLSGFFSWKDYRATEDARSLRDALAKTRKSIELTDTTALLYLDELDNLAYFSSEAGLIADALDAIERLREAGIPSSRANWFETLGNVYLAGAKFETFTPLRRLEYVTLSKLAYKDSLKGFLTNEVAKRVRCFLRDAERTELSLAGAPPVELEEPPS